jgi:hypothetical protein
MHGYFAKNGYWLDPQAPHVYQLKCGASVRDIDQCQPLTMITAAPSWGMTKNTSDKMIIDLKNCPKDWWDSLPLQG